MLKAMETTSEAIAAFWTMESDLFLTQGQKMEANEAKIPEMMVEIAAINDKKEWNKAKDDFETYVSVMTQITSKFNFHTDAKLPDTQDIKLGNLDFVLHIPASIDVSKIMSENV
jgi:hypothetical protein